MMLPSFVIILVLPMLSSIFDCSLYNALVDLNIFPNASSAITLSFKVIKFNFLLYSA